MDRNLPHQRHLAAFDLVVVVLRARSKRIEDLVELMPEVRRHLLTVRSGQAVEIFPPQEQL
jgi:hypothetical protein